MSTHPAAAALEELSKRIEPKRPPKLRRRKTPVGVVSEPDWQDWLGRFADACHKSRQELLSLAIQELATRVGFEPPPPRL